MKKHQFRFYHLQQTPLPRVLGDLAAKAVSQGRRVIVATPDAAAAQALDDGLWTFRQDAFLAHGRDGDPDPALTPVWISADPAIWQKPVNDADILILTGGLDAPDAAKCELVCDLFDGNDPAQLEAARMRWTKVKDAGHEVSYYQQTAAGGWEQKGMSIDYIKEAETRLQGLKTEGRYREFVTLGRPLGGLPKGFVAGREVIVWCSNDYLGMSQHPIVLEAQHIAIDQYGAGAGGTRNIAGTTPLIENLEEAMAALHGMDSALVCSSGYVANQAGLGTLAALYDGCVVFSDEKNHASMIHGIKDSKAAKQIFRHNDMDDLEARLKATPIGTPKLIAIESVYSMDGSIAPLAAVRDLAARYNALTYVDEVHAVGLYGAHGAGQIEAQGLTGQFDVIEGTFGKAYGGYGGFLAGRGALIDAIRSFAASFIFTTALPPAVLAGNLASVKHLAISRAERAAHGMIVDHTRTALKAAYVPLLDSPSHILPVMINCPHRCKDVGTILLNDHNIYVQPINYPTVPRGMERLRLTPSARHRPQHADALARALNATWAKLDLKTAA